MPDAPRDKYPSTAAASKPATASQSVGDRIEVIDRLASTFPLIRDEARVIDRVFGVELAKLFGE